MTIETQSSSAKQKGVGRLPRLKIWIISAEPGDRSSVDLRLPKNDSWLDTQRHVVSQKPARVCRLPAIEQRVENSKIHAPLISVGFQVSGNIR